jgi:5,10-methylenetetrahydromethanopterin reductase
MDISCAFAPCLETPAHVELAESLGYQRAWLYDSPALYPDVWLILGRCAERTTRIGLGPGVLVPSLRHPMVNAAAITGLAGLAPGRVAVAIGAGFSGRIVLGQRPMRWADVAEYVKVLRLLLRGEEAEWAGAVLRMLHPPGFGADRPIEVPILIGADGPKGLSVAAELGDGVFSVGVPQTGEALASWRALLSFGTVLDAGEELTSDRVISAVGPAAAVLYHSFYERGGDAVDGLPGGATWRASVESVPLRTRHLAVHEGHLVEANDRDRNVLGDPDVASQLLSLAGSMALVGTAEEIRERLHVLGSAGVTEIAYQPAGSNIERELRAFAAAAELQPV